MGPACLRIAARSLTDLRHVLTRNLLTLSSSLAGARSLFLFRFSYLDTKARKERIFLATLKSPRAAMTEGQPGATSRKRKGRHQINIPAKDFPWWRLHVTVCFQSQKGTEVWILRKRGEGRMESQALPGGISIHQLAVGKCGLREGDAF